VYAPHLAHKNGNEVGPHVVLNTFQRLDQNGYWPPGVSLSYLGQWFNFHSCLTFCVEIISMQDLRLISRTGRDCFNSVLYTVTVSQKTVVARTTVAT